MNTAARTRTVHRRFVYSLADEIGAVAQPMTRFEWAVAELADPSNLHKPYGWIPPYEVEDGSVQEAVLIIAPFCPALIADQTRFLYDKEFDLYLDTIDYSMSLHIIHRHVAGQEREELIDGLLWDSAPGSMELQNRVLMRILDTLTGNGTQIEG